MNPPKLPIMNHSIFHLQVEANNYLEICIRTDLQDYAKFLSVAGYMATPCFVDKSEMAYWLKTPLKKLRRKPEEETALKELTACINDAERLFEWEDAALRVGRKRCGT